MISRGIRAVGDLLRENAAAKPEHVTHLFLGDDGVTPRVTLTMGELWRRASLIAERTAEATSPGDRVALILSPNETYPPALLGVLLAGRVAVPISPPDPTNVASTLPRFAAVLQDCDARAVLTEASICDRLRPHIARLELARDLRWVILADQDAGAAASHAPAWDGSPDSVALIMYTSGSTGAPKGVVISHRNLLEALASDFSVEREGGADAARLPSWTTVTWIPPYHISGVHQTIRPLRLGGKVVAMHPFTFLARPARWLQAISTFAADFSGGPNFALDLLTTKVSASELEGVELGCLKALWIGSEDNRVETFERFARRFEPYGLRPWVLSTGYGMTEVPLTISSTIVRHGRALTSLRLDRSALERGVIVPVDPSTSASGGVERISNGQVVPNARVVIVDPESCREAQADRIGEIWVRSPRVALGYWKRPEETERAFRAQLSDTGEGPFLRTGDLGFLREGNLYITGRLKEIIIVRGRNLYPADLEATAKEVDPTLASRGTVAFALEGSQGESVGVLQEIAADEVPRREEILEGIRRALAREHRVQPGLIALVEEGALPRSAARKVQRTGSRIAFLAGRLTVLAEWRPSVEPNAGASVPDPPADLETWLVGRIAVATGAPPSTIAFDRPLADCGLDSLGIVEILGAIEATFGVEMPPAAEFAAESAGSIVARLRAARVSGTQALAARVRLLEDAMLPVDFSVASGRLGRIEPTEILITGSTGFLGSFLLSALLERTSARAHVLVRAADEEVGMARLRRALEGYGLPSHHLRRRVSVWPGDVSQPGLGLDADRFAALSTKIDAVYHSAATLNFVYRYKDLRATNVLGTREALRLAAASGAHFHHFSTVGVFPFSGRADGRAFVEEDIPDPDGLATGYAKSKWVAEEMVREAGRRGLPVTVYRIGEVIGHSRTGICRVEDDFLALILRAMRRLNARAHSRRLMHLLVPVDYVAESISVLSRSGEARGRTFHLVGPLEQSVDLSAFKLALGPDVRAMPGHEWFAVLKQHLVGVPSLSPLMPFIERVFASDLDLQVDSTATRESLRAAGIAYPPLGESLRAYEGYLCARGFFDD